MDTARIRRDFVASLRLPVTDERRLLGGALVVALGYAIWIGATGAALNFGLDFGEQPASVAAWQATSTASLAAAVLLWVVIPAGVVTYLVDRAVTNASGNVRQYYRVSHPLLLVAPYLLVVGLGLAAAVALGELPVALLGVLSVFGLFALIRTVPASYRVFSFSHPRLAELFVFAGLAVTALAIPVSAASVTGRQAIVDAAAAGIGAKFGTTAVETLLTGSTTVAGVAVPSLLGAVAVVPAGLALLYTLVQLGTAQVQRMRQPDVPRSELRTGQRYPDFARPMYGKSSSSSSAPTSASDGGSTVSSSPVSSPTSSTDASSSQSNSPSGTASATTDTAESTPDSDESDEAEGDNEDEQEDLDETSHTRVFSPPAEDDDMEFDTGGGTADSSGSTAETAGQDTAVVSESGYRCPSCDDRFDADASFEFCPTCGSELEKE